MAMAIGRAGRAGWRSSWSSSAVRLLCFDTTFEIFHGCCSRPGYNFDPRNERLVQLFPEEFWSETSIVLAVAMLGARLPRVVASRRAEPGGLAGPAESRSGTRPDGAFAVNGVPIARIFGIEVRVHSSWVISSRSSRSAWAELERSIQIGRQPALGVAAGVSGAVLPLRRWSTSLPTAPSAATRHRGGA